MRKTIAALLAVVLILLSIGIVMLASASTVKGISSYHDPYYFLKRQIVWLVISLAAGVVLLRFDYHWWRRLAVPVAVASVLLLILVLVPHIGMEVKGSRRWLRLAFLSLQPSEFAKFSLVAVLASWMAGAGPRAQNMKEGLFIPLTWIALIAGPTLLEPDFGTAFLLGLVGMTILFVGGTRIGYLLITGTVGLCGFILMVLRDPVRLGRILSFVMPEKYPDKAYHLIQSKVAFIRGGWFGVGLGNGIQKQFYLPEAYTDFILPIIGEELGFVATIAVVLLFFAILVCGVIISTKAPDPFGKLLGFGLTMTISYQAAINIGVVTGCLPTKGLPLPFISYGGSSLLVCLASIAVLLNIARHCTKEHPDEHTMVFKDKAHDF